MSEYIPARKEQCRQYQLDLDYVKNKLKAHFDYIVGDAWDLFTAEEIVEEGLVEAADFLEFPYDYLLILLNVKTVEGVEI